jgi:crotonobetainyl-CoA:carnitine CoA-transferase CaiB-like acyl-CoA transferase
VSGIAMALFRRERTGRGAHVDMAMFDALVSLNENAIAMSATTGKEMLPSGRLSYTAPFGIFRASDGYLCIAVLGEKMWHRFCEALERSDLAADPGLASGTLRSAAMDGELGAVIAGWLAPRTRNEAIDRHVACGVPAGIVATPFDVIASPQTEARQLLWDVPSCTGATTRMVGSPIRITPGGYGDVGEVPAPGQDTVDVLTTLGGYSAAEVDALLSDGVVEAWQS